MLKAHNVTWSTDATQLVLDPTLKPTITGGRKSRSTQKQNRLNRFKQYVNIP